MDGRRERKIDLDPAAPQTHGFGVTGQNGDPKKDRKGGRKDAKLAAALRENLRRRKTASSASSEGALRPDTASVGSNEEAPD
jgi:hypothetical protein